MNIIFIAPPAAGKGTQSSFLVDKCGYIQISTGDLLRNEIANQTALGAEIENIISKGELVSDNIITTLLKNELKKYDNQKFILDGYPRDIEQAKVLEGIIDIDKCIVLYLELDIETAKKRALGRIVCSNCGASYNKYFQHLMPKENGVCDECHGELIVRDDDNEETFYNRFNTYLEETKEVLYYYLEKGKLFKIDARQSDEEISENIMQILKSVDVDNN